VDASRNKNTNISVESELFRKLTIIIVTFQSRHCLLRLSKTLSFFPNVIFSDNASTDGTIGEIHKLMPRAQVISHRENIGFGAANNAAIALTKTDYALLLNPDCSIEKSSIGKLMEHALSKPSAAISAPQLIRRDGSKDISYRWPRTHWVSAGPAADGPICCGYVSGAIMLLKLNEFRDVGFFDENFFLYYEDDDLCLKCFNQQKEIILFPDVTATHHNRGSVKSSFPWKSEYLRGYHHIQSKITFYEKYKELLARPLSKRKILFIAVVAIPLRVISLTPKHLVRLFGRIMGVIQYKKSRLYL